MTTDRATVDLNSDLAFRVAGAVQALHVPGEFWDLTVQPQPDQPGNWIALLHPDPANTKPRDPLWLATGANEQAVRACARQWRTSANDLAMHRRIRDTARPHPAVRAAFRLLALTAGDTASPTGPSVPPVPNPTRGAHR